MVSMWYVYGNNVDIIILSSTSRMDWEDISFIIRSRYRKNVLFLLYSEPSTPTKLSKQTSLVLSHVSRTLKQLEDNGFVECLSSSTKGKIYNITSKGRSIVEIIKEKNL